MTDRPGEKEKPKEPEELTVNLVPAGDPQLGRVYANYVQVSHSPWEFTLRFCLAPTGGDFKKSLKKGQVTVEMPIIIDVMVSPALMPGIIKALQTNFDKFQKKIEKATTESAEQTTH